MTKKRHHYVPRAYLKAFCDPSGQLTVYHKDAPGESFRQRPATAALQKYYYSQPTPDGDRDNDRLENLFCEYESEWPPIVESLRDGRDANDKIASIAAFIALQRARVPATRDACEAFMASMLRRVVNKVSEQHPSSLPEKLRSVVDSASIAVNPHESIHAMVHVINGTAQVLDQIGLSVVPNPTARPFITSDNPVAWLDPEQPAAEARPYALATGGKAALLFPIAPDALIYGHSDFKREFDQHGLLMTAPATTDFVDEMNWHLCRFAYRAVFASEDSFGDLVEEHRDASPIVRSTSVAGDDSGLVLHRYGWGRPEPKPRWEPRSGMPEETPREL